MEVRSPRDRWDAKLYDGQHSFVHQFGAGVVELLAPQPGERILDVGCGTGHLTRKIADAGAEVLGVDASPAMLAEARQNFPELSFEIADASNMKFRQPFDAVFSNAVLHWVIPPEQAAARMRDALKPGGRLVVEFGGRGCVRQVLAAAQAAGAEMGLDLKDVVDINYFPSVGEYAGVLERNGFEVNLAMLFDRPTPLAAENGLREWIRMFRGGVIERLPAEKLDEYFAILQRIARPLLYGNGTWRADYRRLRMVAKKVA